MDKISTGLSVYEKLQDCFELEIDSEVSGQKKIKLTFPKKRFRHFCGAEKLTDLASIFTDHNPDEARNFYNSVIAGTITDQSLSASNLYSIPISHGDGIEYFLEDRLNNLAHIYEYFHNSKDHLQNRDDTNIYIYTWKLNANSVDRPCKSNISADLMICFTDPINKKTDNEKSYIWFQDTGFVQNGYHLYEAITGFQSNLDYTKHETDRNKNPKKLTILSLNEIQGLKRTNLITAPQEVYDKIADREARRDPLTEELKASVAKQFSDLKHSRDEYLKARQSKKNKSLNREDVKGWKGYETARNKMKELIKNKSDNWKELFFMSLGTALKDANTDEKEKLIREELSGLDPEGKYKPKYWSFSNNISIDASGTATIAPVVALSMADRWKNFKDFLQQMPKNFTDNLKLTFQSLGNDIKNLGKGVSKQISKTTDGLTSSKKSDKIADRTAELKDAKPIIDNRQSKIDRSNNKSIKETMDQTRADKYNAERKHDPKEHNKKRDHLEQ